MANTAGRGDIDPEEFTTEEVAPLGATGITMLGPGLDQVSARRVAQAIGGLAQGARPGTNRWILGGWAPHELWIVTSIDSRWIVHDGVDRRTPEWQRKRPVPPTAIVQ